MTISNLPEWPGADAAYSRASKWTQAVSIIAYGEYFKTRKRKSDKFYAPEDVTTMIAAMNKGDEEVIKGMNAKYQQYWI